ncbi:MAG: hypothetical protein U0176_08620 [Bacteroidia bacterium]
MKVTPGEKRASEQVDETRKSMKRRMRSMWVWMGISFAGASIFLALFLVFPRWTHSHKLISVDFIHYQGKPLLVSYWMEYSTSEDNGDCLEGFVVRTADGKSGKELNEVFMPHEANGMPYGGEMLLLEDGSIWVNCTNAGNFMVTMPAFLAKLQLSQDGSLALVPDAVPAGLGVSGAFSHGRIPMSNQYNEPMCYDIPSAKATPGTCPWEEDRIAQGDFFLAHKEAGSTRSRLWYVHSRTAVPDPNISVGFVNGDRPLPGVHIFNDLKSNYYKITEERLAYYQTMGDSGEFKFTAVGEDDYLVNALLSYHDSACAILQLPGKDPSEPRYACYFPDGHKGWEVTLDTDDKLYLAFVPHWLDDQVVLVAKESMAVGIDPSSSKVLWEWRP